MMNASPIRLRDGGIALLILTATFLLNLLLTDLFDTPTMVPSIFILGVFLISLWTEGHIWWLVGTLLSVLAVNFAFTYPYWAFDLISPECISSAVVMFIVAWLTGTLTTKLKRQEKLKAEAEKERMRGNLLRAVSHDLRTPLTSIYGACSAMQDSFDEIPRDKHLKMLGDVCSDAQWLVRMVENLLSVTRVDAGQVRLSKQDTVLDELVDAVLVKFRKHYPDQRVELGLPEEFVAIPMDPMLMEQVLMNLLENAVFHARGMTHLWLRVVLEGDQAVFTVEDDGCGIPEEKLSRLFTGLLDSEAPTDTSRSSMGIGLAVCSTIVRAHGGEIRADNRPGGGARFRFTLTTEEDDYGKQQI